MAPPPGPDELLFFFFKSSTVYEPPFRRNPPPFFLPRILVYELPPPPVKRVADHDFVLERQILFLKVLFPPPSSRENALPIVNSFVYLMCLHNISSFLSCRTALHPHSPLFWKDFGPIGVSVFFDCPGPPEQQGVPCPNFPPFTAHWVAPPRHVP